MDSRLQWNTLHRLHEQKWRSGMDPWFWCNPRVRALGVAPTINTGHPRVDAFLWVKQPGESGGTCGGGPPARTWWAAYALELIRMAATVGGVAN